MPETGNNARVIRLNSDMISLKDTSATTIIVPDYFEAPFIHKREDTYYFSYSTNWTGGSPRIDYLTSSDPMSGLGVSGHGAAAASGQRREQ